MYYITTGVPSTVLAPQPHEQMMNIVRLVAPDKEDSNKSVQILRADLEEEVKSDYYFSLKKIIGIQHISFRYSNVLTMILSSILHTFYQHVKLSLSFVLYNVSFSGLHPDGPVWAPAPVHSKHPQTLSLAGNPCTSSLDHEFREGPHLAKPTSFYCQSNYGPTSGYLAKKVM